MARNAQGRYCCECDYCAVSPCSNDAVSSIFLTDHPQTHDYWLFCEAHRARAEADVRAYLAAHPGVAIDPNE